MTPTHAVFSCANRCRCDDTGVPSRPRRTATAAARVWAVLLPYSPLRHFWQFETTYSTASRVALLFRFSCSPWAQYGDGGNATALGARPGQALRASTNGVLDTDVAQYLVAFTSLVARDTAIAAMSAATARQPSVVFRVTARYGSVFPGLAASASPSAVELLADRPDVVALVLDSQAAASVLQHVGASQEPAGRSPAAPLPSGAPRTLRRAAPLDSDATPSSVAPDHSASLSPSSAGAASSARALAQGNAPWGLDRVNQRALPLDGLYSAEGDGAGARVYVVDTGVRTTHADLAGRVEVGLDAVTPGGTAQDCNGHGTHVAGMSAISMGPRR